MTSCGSNSDCTPGEMCESGVCGPCNGIITYSSSIPLNQLPACMRSAVEHSIAGTQTDQDDKNMGTLCGPNLGASCGGASITPYCQQDAYKNSIYCACQNTSVAWTECIFAPCNEQEAAYKTTAQKKVLDADLCPTGLTICQNITEIGGSGNVSNVYQNFNCGGVIENFITNIQAHPFIAIVVMVLILSVVMLIVRPGAGSRRSAKTLPPPQLVIPENV